jgi:hypothetical protein
VIQARKLILFYRFRWGVRRMVYPLRAAVAFHVPFPLPGPLPRQQAFFFLSQGLFIEHRPSTFSSSSSFPTLFHEPRHCVIVCKYKKGATQHVECRPLHSVLCRRRIILTGLKNGGERQGECHRHPLRICNPACCSYSPS